MVLMLAAGLFVGSWCTADEPIATMPTEVTLTSGRVLRNVSVIRWDTNRVVLKHAAGADPIAFELFKTPSPVELMAIRAGSFPAKKGGGVVEAGVVPDGREMRSYFGRIVVTADGVETKAPAGTMIYIRDPQTRKAPKGGAWGELGMVILTISTDAEGGFSFKCPKDRKFVIQAHFMRHGGRNGTEAYEWRIASEKIMDPQTVRLTEANASKSTTPYTW